MSTILMQIIFGWPAILLSIALAMIGLLKKWPWMLVASGLVCIPFAWYLSGYPAVRSVAILLPVFQFGSAWAVLARKMKLAWLLLAPVAIVTIGLAVLVLTQ
jgi:hypothetical protein